MTHHVMLLDVLEVGRVLERGHIPVHRPQPAVERGIAGPDVSDVALEVLDVDDVEADQGHEEADVGFGHVRAVVVWG